MSTALAEFREQLTGLVPSQLCGSIVRTTGLTAAVASFPAPVGALVHIERHGGPPLPAEVIGFSDDLTLVYLLETPQGLRQGNRVRLVRSSRWIRVGDGLLGRVIDAQGRPIDGGPPPALDQRAPLERPAPPATSRPRIEQPLSTGVRAIDGLVTCGQGQRLGIFAGSGVGKSITLGMMARYTTADVNVVALVGERGREVNEFIQRDLGPGLAQCDRRRHQRRAGLGPRAGGAGCHDRGGVFSRPRPARVVDDGFAHAAGPGAARNRPGGRRAAHDARLSAVGVRDVAAAAGTGRSRRPRQHYRTLLGARRGRRSSRANRRRRPRPARRSRVAVAQARLGRSLSGGRRVGKRQPADE